MTNESHRPHDDQRASEERKGREAHAAKLAELAAVPDEKIAAELPGIFARILAAPSPTGSEQ